MPGKGGAARRRSEPVPGSSPPEAAPARRRPDAETVRWAAGRVLIRPGRPFGSQAELRRALLRELRGRDRRFALGGRRMREILLELPGIELKVRFAERPTRRPLARCPVCASDLVPIRNRTLWGDRVTLGYRCRRCGYWTHLRRRVPVRYEFVPVGPVGDGAEAATLARPRSA